jgi:zinc transporter
MGVEEALIYGGVLDGTGGAKAIDWSGIPEALRGDRLVWLHLNRTTPGLGDWLESELGLVEETVEALLAEDTRPRFLRHDGGIALNLRGINLNEGANPEDMVSVRVWATPRLIVTLRLPKVMAIQDIRDALARGEGPRREGEFLEMLVDGLIRRIGPFVDMLEDEIDRLEEQSLEQVRPPLRGRLAENRRRVIILRRFMAPQRLVLEKLYSQPITWIDDEDRRDLREAADNATRLVEDLEAARERAAVIQEEAENRQAEALNRNTYLLTLVAAIFLPLSFVTGLLGINVGGIPLAESPYGFAIICAILAVMTAVVVWIFRRKDMM